LGAILGHILRDTIPILDKGLKVGTDQLSMNLYLIDVSFSIHVNITLCTIIGILIAVWLGRLQSDLRSQGLFLNLQKIIII